MEWLREKKSSNAFVMGVLLLWFSKGHHTLLWLAAQGLGTVLMLYGIWLDNLGVWRRVWRRRKERP